MEGKPNRLAELNTSNKMATNSYADHNSGTPNLNLTAEERRVFGQLFREADTENIGVITGDIAVKFFEKTRLEPRILGEVSTSLFARWIGYEVESQ